MLFCVGVGSIILLTPNQISLVDRLRYLGVTLHFFGILTVAVEMRSRARLFGLSSLVKELKDWAASFPCCRSRKPSPHTANAGFGMDGAAEVRVTLARDGSVEKRLIALENVIDFLTFELSQVRSDLSKESDARKQALQVERKDRQSSNEQVEATMRKAFVGTVHLELIGLILVLFGLIVGVCAPEISNLWVTMQ